MAIGHPQFYRHSGDALWQQVPAELKQEVNQHIDALTDVDIGKPCIWLDLQTRRCKHYDHRPQMCRDFEMGNPHCQRMRESYGIVGAGTGGQARPARRTRVESGDEMRRTVR